MDECSAHAVVFSNCNNTHQPGCIVHFCVVIVCVYWFWIAVCRLGVLHSSWGFLLSPVWFMTRIKDCRVQLWFWLWKKVTDTCKITLIHILGQIN